MEELDALEHVFVPFKEGEKKRKKRKKKTLLCLITH